MPVLVLSTRPSMDYVLSTTTSIHPGDISLARILHPGRCKGLDSADSLLYDAVHGLSPLRQPTLSGQPVDPPPPR